MASLKAFLLGLVISFALVQWNSARNGALRQQLKQLTLQKFAKDQGLEPPAQNDTNPMATIRQRLQQKIVDDYAKLLGLSNSTSAAGNSTSSGSNSTSGSSNSTSSSSNSTSDSSNSKSGSSNPSSDNSNSTSSSSNSTAKSGSR